MARCALNKDRIILDQAICRYCGRKCGRAGKTKGDIRAIEAIHESPQQQKEMMDMKTGICIRCGDEKKIKAKGMCNACYQHSLKIATTTERPVVLLDFTGHEGLLEELKQRAQQEFRPLEWQIMRDLDVEASHATI